MRARPGVLALLACLLSVPPGMGMRRGRQEALQMLDKVLEAISRALGFYEQEQMTINLDALIGTRLVDGQLFVFLKHIDRGATTLPSHVVSKIRHLQLWAQDFTDRTIPIVAKGQPKYYHKIGALLDPGLWRHDYPSTDLDLDLVTKPLYQGEAMNEHESDNCLAEFIGTGKTKKLCQVSKKCWFQMTAPGYRKYSLSHQVFYLEIGEMLGCFGPGTRPLLEQLNGNFCANMFQEATEIVQAGFPEERRDLFMEQAGLCGIVGYRTFFRKDWLRKILSWQRPEGCYGLEQPPDQALHGPSNVSPGKTNNAGKIRRKREERLLRDGCQSHRTAVALAALAQYVRYITEYIDSLQRH